MMADDDRGLRLLTPYKIDLLDGVAFVLGLVFVAWWLL